MHNNCFEEIANEKHLLNDNETIKLLQCFKCGDIDKQFISYLNITNIEILRYICNDLQRRKNNQQSCRTISSIIDFFHQKLFPELSLHIYDKTCYHREPLYRNAFLLSNPSNEYLYRLIRVYLVLQQLKTPVNTEHINNLINYCSCLAIIWRDISHPYAGNRHCSSYTRTYTKSFKDVTIALAKPL